MTKVTGSKIFHSNAAIFIAIIIILAFYFSLLFYFFYYKDSNFTSIGCGAETISIEGEPRHREKVIEALEFVESKNCGYLLFISDNSKKIDARYAGLQTGQYRAVKKESVVVNPFKGSLYLTASIIVHEACHSFQDKGMLPFLENDCTTTQYNFLKNMNAPQEDLKIIEGMANYNPGYTLDGRDVFIIWQEKQ